MEFLEVFTFCRPKEKGGKGRGRLFRERDASELEIRWIRRYFNNRIRMKRRRGEELCPQPLYLIDETRA